MAFELEVVAEVVAGVVAEVVAGVVAEVVAEVGVEVEAGVVAGVVAEDTEEGFALDTLVGVAEGLVGLGKALVQEKLVGLVVAAVFVFVA